LRVPGKKVKQKGKQHSKLREAGARTESNFRLALKSRVIPGVASS
jgi:hypothetical protein